jgi:hypothetical protein
MDLLCGRPPNWLQVALVELEVRVPIKTPHAQTQPAPSLVRCMPYRLRRRVWLSSATASAKSLRHTPSREPPSRRAPSFRDKGPPGPALTRIAPCVILRVTKVSPVLCPGLVECARVPRRLASCQHIHGRRLPLCERRLNRGTVSNYGLVRHVQQENGERCKNSYT